MLQKISKSHDFLVPKNPFFIRGWGKRSPTLHGGSFSRWEGLGGLEGTVDVGGGFFMSGFLDSWLVSFHLQVGDVLEDFVWEHSAPEVA